MYEETGVYETHGGCVSLMVGPSRGREVTVRTGRGGVRNGVQLKGGLMTHEIFIV